MTTLSGKIRKEDRRISRTKKSISTAFLHLLKNNDISKITIKELCDLADINRKTFYMHYNSVGDVLSEIENTIIQGFEKNIQIIKNKKTEMTITDIFFCISELLNNNSDTIYQLVQIDELYGLERKVKSALKNTILQTIIEEYTNNINVINLSMEYIISGVVSMYIEWFYGDNPMPFEMLTRIAIEFVDANIKIVKNYSS